MSEQIISCIVSLFIDQRNLLADDPLGLRSKYVRLQMLTFPLLLLYKAPAMSGTISPTGGGDQFTVLVSGQVTKSLLLPVTQGNYFGPL